MKRAKKFETFDELKSSETKTSDYRLSLAKHSEFEKAMKEINQAKAILLETSMKADSAAMVQTRQRFEKLLQDKTINGV